MLRVHVQKDLFAQIVSNVLTKQKVLIHHAIICVVEIVNDSDEPIYVRMFSVAQVPGAFDFATSADKIGAKESRFFYVSCKETILDPLIRPTYPRACKSNNVLAVIIKSYNDKSLSGVVGQAIASLGGVGGLLSAIKGAALMTTYSMSNNPADLKNKGIIAVVPSIPLKRGEKYPVVHWNGKFMTIKTKGVATLYAATASGALKTLNSETRTWSKIPEMTNVVSVSAASPQVWYVQVSCSY